uniref:hypothetical protein n=1 Tax=Cupriavidus gilardii TaxID=82541 RepID=UPI002479129D|nr:hypothetical protein [Cupriavidus gilardii]WDE72652.1 hypothetical protein [Cupriavidus gilardii]
MVSFIYCFAVAGKGYQMVERPVQLRQGQIIMAEATADERALPRFGRDPEDGEVRVFLVDSQRHDEDPLDEGSILAGPACYHRDHASAALHFHFGIEREVTDFCVAIARVLGGMVREGQPPAAIAHLVNQINKQWSA